MAPLLEMVGIGKSFPGVKALDGVSLQIHAGEVHALMGENGAGKSTLMKVLAGAYQADEGQIMLEGRAVDIDGPATASRLGIGIIYQEFNLVPQLSVADNIMLGREPRKSLGRIDADRSEREAEALLRDLGVALDVKKPVAQLSVAMQQLVEIAKALGQKSRVLVMDEPSAALTEHELENLMRLIRKLKADGVAIIYISHRMEEVFALCDRVTVLRDGAAVWSAPIDEMTPDKLVTFMIGRPISDSFPKPTNEPGDKLLNVTGLTRKRHIEDVSFQVRAGEIVSIAGLVGSGRTEIARCLFGADSFDSGGIEIGGHTFKPSGPKSAILRGVGFVTEDRKNQGLLLEMSVRENLSLAALNTYAKAGLILATSEGAETEQMVRSLGVKTPGLEQKVKNLSGGNQQKVVLGKWLLANSKLLILDEPTRGIDIGAKAEIYQLMRRLTSQGVGILMITSELPEALGMADRILVMREGKIVGEFSRKEATMENVGAMVVGAK